MFEHQATYTGPDRHNLKTGTPVMVLDTNGSGMLVKTQDGYSKRVLHEHVEWNEEWFSLFEDEDEDWQA